MNIRFFLSKKTAKTLLFLLIVMLLQGGFVFGEPAETAPDSGQYTGSSSDVLSSADDEAKPLTETAAEVRFGGSIETAHGMQLLKPFDYSLSRTVAELFTDISFQGASARISGTAEYNHCTPQRTAFTLKEAFCRYRADNWDITAGRQFIAWGQADGFRLSDRLSAWDMRELGAAPDKQIAVDAIRFRFLHDIFTLETVAVPFFTPDILPPFEGEFIADPEKRPRLTIPLPLSAGAAVSKKAAKRPSHLIDTEIAARLSFFLPGIDFSFSGFYGWDKTPRFFVSGSAEKKLQDPSQSPSLTNFYYPVNIKLVLQPDYYRIGSAGFDAAIPAGDFVIRFEAAYINGRYFTPKQPLTDASYFLLKQQTAAPVQLTGNSPVKKDQLLMLAGMDFSRSGWFFSVQYFEDIVFCGKDELSRGIHEGTVTLNLSKTVLRDRLKLAASAAIGVNYGDTASSYSAAYTLSDFITISGGADVYTKGMDGKGRFSALHPLTSGWIKFRFAF